MPISAALGSPPLAIVGACGVLALAHTTAWWAVKHRLNRLAVSIIWLKLLIHAAVGSLVLGWDSGFHHFLM